MAQGVMFILVTDTDSPLGSKGMMSLWRRQLYPLSIDFLDNQSQLVRLISATLYVKITLSNMSARLLQTPAATYDEMLYIYSTCACLCLCVLGWVIERSAKQEV